jgi:hypothetical protein
MDLNGALSNPFERSKSLLIRLNELHPVLLGRSAETPRQPRSAPPTAAPVLEAVTLVLERARVPMRTIEIHDAAQQLLRRPLLRSSVRGILSAHTLGDDPRFTRIRRGLYQLRD